MSYLSMQISAVQKGLAMIGAGRYWIIQGFCFRKSRAVIPATLVNSREK